MPPENAGTLHAEIVRPGFTRLDPRGSFTEMLNGGTWASLICGSMSAGAVMGNHYHRRTEVFFCLTRGSALLDIIDVRTGARFHGTLVAPEGVRLKVMESHAIRFREDSDFVMLKSLAYDPTDPDTYGFEITIGG